MAAYRKESVGTIILSPTRELAAQIAGEAVRATHHMKDWGVQLFIGGASKDRQMRDFARARRDIVVATPGRMYDMLQERSMRPFLSQAKMLILDEADTLLDMGFKDAINDIVELLPPKTERQTFLFSATVSPEVRQIARKTLKPEHAFIDCVPKNESNSHIHIPQYHTVLSSASEQIPHVFRLLAQDALLHPEGGKAIIFLPTTKMTELFATLVNTMRSSLPWGSKGTRVLEMHSRKTQSARDRTAEEFRNAKGPGYSILVTSDVSARGVDYPGVTRVIQVGIPPSKENYVHRLGRTGRAGKAGRGDIVLQPWEARYVTRQLQDMPLQAYRPDALSEDLEKLAAEYDANPTVAPSAPAAPARPAPRGRSRSPSPMRSTPTIEMPTLERIKGMQTKLDEVILPNLAESDVTEAFASQLGFYIGHAHELNLGRQDVLMNLENWAQDAFKLQEKPTVSDSLLAKMGFGRGGGGGGGGRGGSRFGGGGGGRGGSRGGYGGVADGRRRAGDDSWAQSRPSRGGAGGAASRGSYDSDRPRFR